MTDAIHPPLPWSDEDLLALGDTAGRVELLDGNLLWSPAPTPDRQTMASELYVALRTPSRAAGLRALERPFLRLGSNRLLVPDLAVADVIDGSDPVLPAEAVRLVGELSSAGPASPGLHGLKETYYASAGIPWFLLVKTTGLSLYRLVNGAYAAHSFARAGEVLHLTEPVEATIRPEDLLP